MAGIVKCEFVGGPLDGTVDRKKLELPPGSFPMFGHIKGNFQYVYQACRFLDDEENDSRPLRMEFVQIVGKHEKLY